MRKWTWKRGLAVMLGLILGIQAPVGKWMPTGITYAYTARSATINASSLNVRSGPGTSYSKVGSLTRGAAVTVVDETTGTDGRAWYQIRFSGTGGTSSGGYVLNTYVKFPVSYSHDTDFESYLNAQGFPESYKAGLRQLHAQYPNWVFTAQNTGLDWETVIENESVLGRNLVHTNSISSYKSLADGAYNWDNGVWTGFDGSTWVAASEDAIRYYMDPRNFLDEISIFQFLNQTYYANLHTREGLQSMLNGTFMEGNVGQNAGSGNTDTSGGPGVVSGPGVSSGNSSTVTAPGNQDAAITNPSGNSSGNGISFTAPTKSDSDVQLVAPHASISRKETALVGSAVITAGPGANGPGIGQSTGISGSGTGTDGTQSYAEILMQAAAQSGVNPYVLAAMIIQEQGSNGRGSSISGRYGGYSGYYNYFNVGAYAYNGMSAVERGLWYASQSGNYGRPWNSVYSSIIGGAQFYGSNYVNAGQDTLYLKKFNVQGSNMYKHQYMTNVDGASAEGSIFAEGFSPQLKATALQFKIPVYKNMPDAPCEKPVRDGSPNNKLNSLGVNGFALTPTFNKNTVSYDLIVDYSVSDVTLYANAVDAKANISGIGTTALHDGINELRVKVRAENGDEREYVIHIVRQNNGPTYNAGIGAGTVTAGSGNAVSSGPGAVFSAPAANGGSTVTLIGPGGQ